MRPRNIEFEITTACNYSCLHCYCNAGKKSKVELSTEEIFEVIDQLVQAEVEILDVVGGEPLLRNDLLKIFSYAKSKGLSMIMNTNASLATKDLVNKIKAIVPDLHVGVSLDGPVSEVHDKIRGKGTFESTMKGLKNFLEAGFNVTVLFVVNRLNYSYIDDMVLLAKDLGTSLYVDRFIPVGRGMINKELLLPTRDMIEHVANRLQIFLKRENSVELYIEENIFGLEECTAGRTHASILVDGNVVPCGHFRYNPEYYVGNVNKERFIDIWRRMEEYRSKLIPQSCLLCALRGNICSAGCLAAAKFYKADIDSVICKR
ncbi:MAG: radical SAM protein [Fervidobacterium sp.]|nr:radical SAM protein [Fervidobacterium sp.]